MGPDHTTLAKFVVLLVLLHSHFALYGVANAVANAEDVEYARDVKPIFAKYCVGCHNATDHESDIQLHNLASIMKGGPDGKIIVPKDPVASPLLRVISGKQDPKMPPNDSPQPTSQDIAVIHRWIEQGAMGNDQPVPLKQRLNVKSVRSSSDLGSAVTSIGFLGNQRLMLGRYNGLYLKQDQWSDALPIEIVGKVTQIRTTLDGRFTVVVSGIPGVGGQATVLENGSFPNATKVVRVIEGHNDTLYTGVLSPDGKLLATAGYDRVIMIWNTRDGQLLRKLEGHNGAIYDLDFDATGKILASASADETIKVWRVENGERLDTFGQCEAEQYAVRFDSPRNRILAAGADKRVRVWKLLSMEKPSVSPMLFAAFAHEAPVTFIAMTADGRFLATASEDKQIKLWNATDLSPLGQLGTVDDVPSGLVWEPNQASLVVSTQSGKLVSLDASGYMKHSSAEKQVAPMETNYQAQVVKKPDSLTALEEEKGHRTMGTAMPLPTDCVVQGLLTPDDMSGDFAGDWYSFQAKANEPWVIQIDASRSGSPMDSLIDILDEKGEPMVRTRLQALRESYFTFRGKDSTISDDFRLHRWEDMELNELLYASGEVVKLWHYPRGPDSGFKVYPGFGKRFTYFDTTATTHALNEPVWIVRELAENEPTIPNGLPVFPIYYSNDDDSNRINGTDSQVTFTAKKDGRYLVRVRDTRGQSGDNYKYKLSIQRPNPRFEFRIEQKEISLRPSVGSEFSVVVDRFDGCDGDIEVQLEGVPEGIQVTRPLIIAAGQHRAVGSLQSPPDLTAFPKEFRVQVTCQSSLNGQSIEAGGMKELLVKINEKPTMPLKVVAMDQSPDAPAITELVIRPGQTISAKLVIERGENKGDIAFGGDDSGRNLPHGCYVDNIGLSGLLIPAGQSIREVFITAAPWVKEQSRPFHLRATVDGNPTTLPMQLRVVAKE
jgi:WD40 repeat protein